MTIWAFLFAAFALALSDFAAHAASKQDWNQCRDLQNVAAADRNIEACTRIINDRKESPQTRSDAYNNRCGLRINKGDLDRAIADCDAAIKLDARNAMAHNNRGTARRAKGNIESAFADFSEAIRLDPKFAEFYDSRGLIWHMRRDYDRAIADFSEAIRLNPKYTPAYNNRGFSWRAKGDRDRAFADFNEAIRLDPKFPGAYRNRGAIWYGRRDFDRAIADFSEVIRLQPTAESYNNRGVAWRDKGDNDRAIADFGEAIRLDPNYALTYNNRGRLFETRGDRARALADYNEVIRRSGEVAVALVVLASRRRGVIRGSFGENAPAIEDFSTAIRLSPKDGESLGYRGYLHAVAGRFGDAEKDIQAARDIIQSSSADTFISRTYVLLADLRRRQKRFDEALTFLKTASAAKEDFYVHMQRAWVYMDSGERKLARNSLERFEKAFQDEKRPAHLIWPDEEAALARLKTFVGGR